MLYGRLISVPRGAESRANHKGTIVQRSNQVQRMSSWGEPEASKYPAEVKTVQTGNFSGD